MSIHLAPAEFLGQEFEEHERRKIDILFKRVQYLERVIGEFEKINHRRDNSRRKERTALIWILTDIGAAEHDDAPMAEVRRRRRENGNGNQEAVGVCSDVEGNADGHFQQRREEGSGDGQIQEMEQ
jgi:hypothetical protein